MPWIPWVPVELALGLDEAVDDGLGDELGEELTDGLGEGDDELLELVELLLFE